MRAFRRPRIFFVRKVWRVSFAFIFVYRACQLWHRLGWPASNVGASTCVFVFRECGGTLVCFVDIDHDGCLGGTQAAQLIDAEFGRSARVVAAVVACPCPQVLPVCVAYNPSAAWQRVYLMF